jgi:hypothetical protein
MAKIPTALCNQLTHMTDGLRRARAVDHSVPDVDTVYGPTIKSLRSKCIPIIDRPPFDLGPTLPQAPSFIPKIIESVEEEGL